LKSVSVESVAEAYLEMLAAREVDYLFGNAGTDFSPLIEAYARRAANGVVLPRPLTVPHEVPAVAMAHGFAMVTGRPQAVMVHVTVGAANALGGIINAARANVPMLFTAGRTPLTESGRPGSRDRHIHWAQESFDQGAMAREYVKWDYELRSGANLEVVVDRALAISRTEPQGPVYLTLPREVLGERLESFEYSERPRMHSGGAVGPDPEAVRHAAEVVAAARTPIIVVKSVGRDPRAVAPLVRLAETLGAPVFDQFHTHVNFPQDHQLHVGYDPAPFFEAADVILAVESDAPWFPALRSPKPETTIVQIAQDPLFSRYPIRGFPADVALAGAPRLSLAALADALPQRDVTARTGRWGAEHRRNRAAWAATASRLSTQDPIEMPWVSRCIGDLLGPDTIVVNEYDLDATQCTFTAPGSYFAASPAAGLGWGLGAALGAKLAAPEKTVICALGDGAYIFGAPTAAHFVARAYDLPILVVIFNNRAWNATKRAVQSFAPDGWAVRTKTMPMTDLEPAPDYEMVCQASGGSGARVERAEELPGALARALEVVRTERRQAVVNVLCRKPA
jgi:acetolactate synthase-1/2/3 large subunit